MILASLMILGCAKEPTLEVPGSDVFYAQIDNEGTKVSIGDNNRLYWNAGDRISIFKTICYNLPYKYKGADGATSAVFAKDFDDDLFFSAEGLDVNAIYAVYPYHTYTKIQPDGLVTAIYDNLYSNMMIAVTESASDNQLLFKNLSTWVKLQIYSDTPFEIKSIAIKGNNEEPLFGTFTVSAEYGKNPEITKKSTLTKRKVIDNINETISTDADHPSEYILSFLPTYFEKGFKIEIEDVNGNIYTKETTKTQDCKRNVILNMPAFKVGPDAPETPDELHTPLTFTAQETGSVKLNKNNARESVNLEYKWGGDNAWRSYTGTSLSLVEGNSVSFRAADSNTSLEGCHFEMTGKIAASGNIMSLLDKTMDLTTIPSEECFNGLFDGCNSLITAPLLPATILSPDCYCNMFRGCSLVTAPELPAISLATGCYTNMFWDCTSLVNAPELPATTLAFDCYGAMFRGCSSLVDAPELPATTLENQCYHSMFFECTSLVNAPELPATTLAPSCYANMFIGCTSLVKAPALPAPYLAAHCYANMFSDCANLNYIKMMALDMSDTSDMDEWVLGVSKTGTFVKSKEAAWDFSGVSGVPEGWDVVIDDSYEIVFEDGPFAMPSPIDLALPSGTKWADRNLGANMPVEHGVFFHFGYIARDSGWYSNRPDPYTSVAGTHRDACHTYLGEHWYIPTPEQYTELLDYCGHNAISYGDNSRLVTFTGANQNKIKIPWTYYHTDRADEHPYFFWPGEAVTSDNDEPGFSAVRSFRCVYQD